MSTMLAIKDQTLNYSIGSLTGTLRINGPSVMHTQIAQCNGVRVKDQSFFVVSATQNTATLRVSVAGHLDITGGACKGSVNDDTSILAVTLAGQTCTFSYTDNFDYGQGGETKGQIVITRQPCDLAYSLSPPAATNPGASPQAGANNETAAPATSSTAASTFWKMPKPEKN